MLPVRSFGTHVAFAAIAGNHLLLARISDSYTWSTVRQPNRTSAQAVEAEMASLTRVPCNEITRNAGPEDRVAKNFKLYELTRSETA
jgi:hypothetical protein